ncbi:MAG TPA: hypothetical protein VI299_30275 [Polyangiales bacterium]
MKWWALILLAGCTLAQRHARTAVDETRLKEAQAVEAERRAPVAFANYRAALKKAATLKPETPARDDYDAEARLWLETAIAIGEREVMAEQRLSEEKAQLELDALTLPLLQERAELGRKAELLAARAIARREAERSLTRAAQRPDLRVRIPSEEQRRTAEALLNRAALIALTLETIDPSALGLAKLRAQLVQVQQLVNKEPELALARADHALFFALSLLAPLRGDEPPSDDERATLAEELAFIGAQVSRGDQGLSGSFERALAGPGLAHESERTLERLCALTRSHIKGPLRLSPHATSIAQGEARAQAVRTSLAHAGCAGGRFAVVATASEDDALEVNFVAY